jgi:hypothetical protein
MLPAYGGQESKTRFADIRPEMTTGALKQRGPGTPKVGQLSEKAS